MTSPSITELETVARCGLCGGNLTPLHRSLAEQASGPWSLSTCRSCGTAWLTPRYTPDAIGSAYNASYQPYHAAALRPTPRTRAEKIRRAVADIHLARTYGYPLPRSHPARFLARFAPATTRAADRLVRHAPAPARGGRLLDVGCSNGAYLTLMRDLGWEAAGIELDQGAVDQARSRGLHVRRGLITDLAPEIDGTFHYITLGHVLEHVHDPVAALSTVRRVLAPGGTVWIATPNLRSLNHKIFGRRWRALDPPRHLVLFTPESLTRLLEQVGFDAVEMVRPVASADWNMRESLQIAGLHRGSRGIARAGGAIVNALSYRWWTLADEMVFVAR